MIQLEIDQREKYFLSNIEMLNPKIVTKCTPQVQPAEEKSWYSVVASDLRNWEIVVQSYKVIVN